jgi:hypothetical protein
LDQLGQKAHELPTDGIKLDEVFEVLEKANRKTDKAYIADLFRVREERK